MTLIEINNQIAELHNTIANYFNEIGFIDKKVKDGLFTNVEAFHKKKEVELKFHNKLKEFVGITD